jgi:hypothetical protein
MIDYGLTLHLNFRENSCYVLLTSDQHEDKLISQFDLDKKTLKDAVSCFRCHAQMIANRR